MYRILKKLPAKTAKKSPKKVPICHTIHHSLLNLSRPSAVSWSKHVEGDFQNSLLRYIWETIWLRHGWNSQWSLEFRLTKVPSGHSYASALQSTISQILNYVLSFQKFQNMLSDFEREHIITAPQDHCDCRTHSGTLNWQKNIIVISETIFKLWNRKRCLIYYPKCALCTLWNILKSFF